MLTIGLFLGMMGWFQTGASPCSAPESRQFDFWIGEWDVYSGDNLGGHNRIEAILDGCVLQENWQGSGGGNKGVSLNFYDPSLKQWRQLWVWQNGTTLILSGGLEGKSMVLSGQSKNAQGQKIQNKITWTPNEDGTVRQLWQTSTDEKKTWRTSFDGLYRKSEKK